MITRAFRVRSCNTARFLMALAVCAILVTLAQPATTQSEPSREPILRIETGMHTSSVRQVGEDAMSRFLVTASEDKNISTPYADRIDYGKIYTAANGEAANTIQSIRSGRNGKVVTCDLESKLQEGRRRTNVKTLASSSLVQLLRWYCFRAGHDEGLCFQTAPVENPRPL